MSERPTLDYAPTTPEEPREPRWRRVAVAVILTLPAIPCLFYGAVGWYHQVFGDADVGGCVVWLIDLVAIFLAWQAIKHWRAVGD